MDEPPAHNHLRPSLRQQIERCEALKHSNRVGGTQHRDSAREADAVRSCRGCREDDRRSGIKELTAMVFANAKGIQADLISVFDLFDELPQTVRRAHSTTAVVERGREAVNPNLHRRLASLIARVNAVTGPLRVMASATGSSHLDCRHLKGRDLRHTHGL